MIDVILNQLTTSKVNIPFDIHPDFVQRPEWECVEDAYARFESNVVKSPRRKQQMMPSQSLSLSLADALRELHRYLRVQSTSSHVSTAGDSVSDQTLQQTADATQCVLGVLSKCDPQLRVFKPTAPTPASELARICHAVILTSTDGAHWSVEYVPQSDRVKSALLSSYFKVHDMRALEHMSTLKVPELKALAKAMDARTTHPDTRKAFNKHDLITMLWSTAQMEASKN